MNPPYINNASRRRPSWNQRFGRKVERVHPLERGGGGGGWGNNFFIFCLCLWMFALWQNQHFYRHPFPISCLSWAMGHALYSTLSLYWVPKTLFLIPWPTLQMRGGWEFNVNVWFPEIKLLFPKQKYNVLSPNSYTHISVRDLYISRVGLPILLQEICGPILGIYKSLTETWMWKLLRLRKRNT